MFLANKYTLWYDQIISRARLRCTPALFEKHHVLPKSLGGTDEPVNLVKLTPREHFVAHLLLSKMTEGQARYKMTTALCLMIKNTSSKLDRTRVTSKHYDMRVAFSRVSFSAEHRAKLSAKAKVRPKQTKTEKTKELHRLTMLGKNTGKSLSAASREKISTAKRGVSLGPLSAETKAKIALANTGKRRSVETKNKMGKGWRILSPNSSIILVKALRTFCIDHQLNYTSMMNTLRTKKPIARGPSLGWMILERDVSHPSTPGNP